MGLQRADATPSPSPARGERRELERIPDAFLDQLKERADIVAVVGRRVSLKKSGASMVGLCPFHSEKSPSFTVSATRNTFHCFGCGAHGSALSFILEHDGLPFRDAVRELAGELGMALPEEMAAAGQVVADRAPLYAAMELGARFFRHVLSATPEAKAYLKGRGLDPAMLKRYLIGYAPDEWRGLKEAFADYERNEHIVTCGLVREKEAAEEGGKRNRYDTFRGRITFGVRDSRGRLVAFGARILGEGEPKYLNSPESPIFDKSGALFGLFEAREAIRAKKEALVVEGYMDVIMLAQHRVENAVASMGTAFTRWHLERLLTQTSRVVFCFDGDAAGRKAALRAMENVAGVLEDEHDIRFMLIPDGQDPDEFVQKHGQQAFEDLKAKAPGFTEFMLSELAARHNGLSSAEDRARFASEAAEIAKRIPYRTKLRRIVFAQIEAESRVPGSAIRAMQSAKRADERRSDIWSRLSDALDVAQAEALKHRDAILAVLDEEVEAERRVAVQLRAIGADAEDDTQAADFLLLRDALRSAVPMICELREAELAEELNRQLAAGDISESDYLRERMALAGGGA